MQHAINTLRFMQRYGDDLTKDIALGDFARQPKAAPTEPMNTPAWIIGHLAYAADAHAKFAGGTPQLSNWNELFGMGQSPAQPPTGDSFPSKDELVTAWHAANERLIEAVSRSAPEALNQPNANPHMRETLPTVGDFLAFSMTGHTAMHLGQLSAWRRADGRPALF